MAAPKTFNGDVTVNGKLGVGQEPAHLLDVVGDYVQFRVSDSTQTIIYKAPNGHEFYGDAHFIDGKVTALIIVPDSDPHVLNALWNDSGTVKPSNG
jgi:hypothetical protein